MVIAVEKSAQSFKASRSKYRGTFVFYGFRKVVSSGRHNSGTAMTINHVVVFSLALGLSGPALASGPACAQKIAGIETQIQHAKESGNQNRIRGLERALSAARNHCTDAGLISDKEEEIAEKQDDIDDILEDMREKEEEGRFDKVKKLERKLAHEQEDLEVLKQELAEIKSLAGASPK